MVAVGGAVALGVLCVYGQAVALNSWSQAGADVVALMDELGRVAEHPEDTAFAVGPARPERNGVFSLDSVAATYALFLAHGEGDGSVFIATVPGEFDYQVNTEHLVPIEWPAFVDVTLEELPKLGGLGQLAQGPGGLYLNGWAVRPGTHGPASVGVFVDGAEEPWAVIPSADLPRDDVGLVRGFGPDHGFDQVLTGEPLAEGDRSVCVRVLDVPRPHGDIDCRSVTIRSQPVVQLVSVANVAGGLQVIGWSIDPQTADPAGVVVSVDGGPEVDFGLTANERGDVTEAWPGYGLNHGFDQILPAVPGPHRVCAVAVRPDGARSTESTCVDVPA